MNLKQAAQRLAVHYQTAYRWVRTGELVAIKVGNRYEISEAAIQQFLSRRANLLSAPTGRPDSAAGQVADRRSAIAELQILVRETRVTAQPCFDSATALAASQIGDGAILRLLDRTGQTLRPVSSFAADPELRAALVGAVGAAGSFPRDTPHWSAAERSGDVHVVHHMPQDLILELMGEAGRFTARGMRVLAAVVAPIFIEDEFIGGLVALQTQSTAPFREDQIALLREAAELCGHAHDRSTRFVDAWEANRLVRDRATALFASGDHPTNLDKWNAPLLLEARAQALVAPDGSIVSCTPRFVLVARLSEMEPSDPAVFARRWPSDGLRDVIEGAAAQAELDPLDPADPKAIVSAVRGPNAELKLLVVDAIVW